MAGLAPRSRNRGADEVVANMSHIALHTADPGSGDTVGSSEVSASRVAISWNAATNGQVQQSADVDLTVSNGTTVAYASFWDAVSGGNYQGSTAINSITSTGTVTVADVLIEIGAGQSATFFVPNQTFSVGALTLSTDDAYRFSATIGTIESVGTLTGTNAGDFAAPILSAGEVTLRPSTNGLPQSSYSLTLSCYSEAAQGGEQIDVSLNISVTANRYTVGTFAQLQNITNNTALTYGTNSIGMLDGAYNIAEADSGIDRSTAISGTRADQIIIEPQNGGNVYIRKFLLRNNNDHVHGFRFNNIKFVSEDINSGEVIRGQFGGTYFTFSNCEFALAGAVTNNSKLGIRMAENGRAMSNIVFDGCTFNNLSDGINSPGSDFSVTNSEFSNIFNDAIHHTTDGSSNPNNVTIENNLIYNKRYAGAGAHGDFMQFNWGSATANVTGFVVRNNVMIRGDGTSGEADGQGIFGNGAGSFLIVDAIIEGNTYVGTFVRGISLPSLSGGRVVGNTILRDLDPTAGGAGANAGIYLENATNTLVADNIANEFVTTGATGLTEINNNVVDDTNAAYTTNFASPQFGANLTTGNLYSSYAVIGSLASNIPIPGSLAYTTMGGTGGTGSFVHPRTQEPTGVSFTDLVDVPASTLEETTANQLSGIGGNGAVVRISGDDSPEFRIRNAADDADVVAWGNSPAIIDNGERLQLRETSSATAGNTVNSTVTAGLTSDTWSITTAAVSYTQNVLRFNDTGFGANLLRPAAFSGVSDSSQFLVSAWIAFDGSPTDYIYAMSGNHVQLVRVGTSMIIRCQNSAGTTLYDRSFTIGSGTVGRTHILCSADLSTTTDHLYVNGVIDGGSATTLTNGTIHYTGTNQTIGARPSSFDRLNGRVADLIVDNTYLDLSNSTIRDRFIDGSGDPVDPGADGSTAVGSQPFYALIGQNAATIEAGAAGVGNVGYGGDVPVQTSYVSGYITDGSF